jgi:protocatechuate 3,4-dioxygenase beta subunit
MSRTTQLASAVVLLALLGACAAWALMMPTTTEPEVADAPVARPRAKPAESRVVQPVILPQPSATTDTAPSIDAQPTAEPSAPATDKPARTGDAKPTPAGPTLESDPGKFIDARFQADGPLGPPRDRDYNPELSGGTKSKVKISEIVASDGSTLEGVEGIAKVEAEASDTVVTDDAATEEEPEPLVTAVQGTVVDNLGLPVPGAVVILYSSFYQRHVVYDYHLREIGRAVTDIDGLFDLRPISLDTVHFGVDGNVVITVKGVGFATIAAKRLDNIKPDIVNTLGTFTLPAAEQGAVIRGRIVDLGDQPLVGATVGVSGDVNPIEYDKVERQVILKECPTAVTDANGEYVLPAVAPGLMRMSIHVNIDCVWNADFTVPAGETVLDLKVRAGGSVRGRIVDGLGKAVSAAVVYGGGNSTHSNADGTFWLDNISKGPFAMLVVHHAFKRVSVPNIRDGDTDVVVTLYDKLPTIIITATRSETGAPVPLVSIDWLWNGGPDPFLKSGLQSYPASPYYNDATGKYTVVVPEGATECIVGAVGMVPVSLNVANVADKSPFAALLAPPAPPEPEPSTE